MEERKIKELIAKAHSSQETPPFDEMWRQARRASPSHGGRGSSARIWWSLGLAGAAAVAVLALMFAVKAPSPDVPGAPGVRIAESTAETNKDAAGTAQSNMEALVASLESLEVYEDYIWSEDDGDVLGEDAESVVAAADGPAIGFEGLFEESPTDFLLEIDFGQGEDKERNVL